MRNEKKSIKIFVEESKGTGRSMHPSENYQCIITKRQKVVLQGPYCTGVVLQGPYLSTCIIKRELLFDSSCNNVINEFVVVVQVPYLSTLTFHRWDCNTRSSERMHNQAPLRWRSRKESKQGKLQGYAERYARAVPCCKLRNQLHCTSRV